MVRQGLQARTQAVIKAATAAADDAAAAAHEAIPNPLDQFMDANAKAAAAADGGRRGAVANGGRGGGGGGVGVGGGAGVLSGRNAASLAVMYRSQRTHVPEVIALVRTHAPYHTRMHTFMNRIKPSPISYPHLHTTQGSMPSSPLLP